MNPPGGGTDPSRYFAGAAGDYDEWYRTPRGAFIDRIETELAFDLLPPRPGWKVLDAGCGTGNFSFKLAERGCTVTGVDISPHMLRRALDRAGREDLPVRFCRMDICDLKFADATFDAVYSMAAFEFIGDRPGALGELWRVLKPGGSLIIGTIAGDSPWGRYYRRAAVSDPSSVFAFADFATREEIESIHPEHLIGSGECLFIPPGAPGDEFTDAREEALAGSARGGFFCAAWGKPAGGDRPQESGGNASPGAGPGRATVIAAGGDPPSSDGHRYILEWVRRSRLLVAVNGGSDVAMQLGLRPDIIIGDLDSIGEGARRRFLRPGGPEVRTFPSRKDRTDTQLALEYLLARDPHPDGITVCGAFGDRIDHGLALVLYSASVQMASPGGPTIVLTDGRQRAFTVTGSAEVTGEPGDGVSLIPLTPEATCVHLEGFEYPLQGGTLRWGQTLGVSNVLAESPARVQIRGEGLLLAVHTPRGM